MVRVNLYCVLAAVNIKLLGVTNCKYHLDIIHEYTAIGLFLAPCDLCVMAYVVFKVIFTIKLGILPIQWL